MKKNIVFGIIIIVLMMVSSFVGVNAANKIDSSNETNKELELYKAYYDASEKLFDEIEEDNEAYFDTDKGADYLYIRAKIKKLN